jgi:hypothetical protein
MPMDHRASFKTAQYVRFCQHNTSRSQGISISLPERIQVAAARITGWTGRRRAATSGDGMNDET